MLHMPPYEPDLNVAVNSTTPPDWMYRINYLKVLERQPPAALPVSNPATGTATPTAAQRIASLRDYVNASENNEDYLLKDSPGSEGVGKNNLGEITFDWGAAENQKFVRHNLWWSRANQDGTDTTRMPNSRFAVLLGRDDVYHPQPTAPSYQG